MERPLPGDGLARIRPRGQQRLSDGKPRRRRRCGGARLPQRARVTAAVTGVVAVGDQALDLGHVTVARRLRQRREHVGCRSQHYLPQRCWIHVTRFDAMRLEQNCGDATKGGGHSAARNECTLGNPEGASRQQRCNLVSRSVVVLVAIVMSVTIMVTAMAVSMVPIAVPVPVVPVSVVPISVVSVSVVAIAMVIAALGMAVLLVMRHNPRRAANAKDRRHCSQYGERFKLRVHVRPPKIARCTR